MPPASSFDRIVAEQRHAVRAALDAEARGRGVELPAQLRDEVAEGAVGAPAGRDAHERLRASFAGLPPVALVAFDTPGVHDYVFRVRRPVDVAGGSHLVAELTRPGSEAPFAVHRLLHQAGVPAGCLVFAGGGRGLVVLAAHRAAEVRRVLETALADETAGDLRTITAELAPPDGGRRGRSDASSW